MEQVKNIEFYFSGVDCPNCAAKVEQSLNKSKIIKNATVNFVTKKVYIEYIDDSNVDILEYVYEIAKKVEHSINITLEEIENDGHHNHEHHHEHKCGCHNHEHKHHHEHECSCHDHEYHHEHKCECHTHEHNHECSHHGCCCNHKHHGELVLFILGICVLITAFVLNLFKNEFFDNVSKGLFIIAYTLLAYKIILKSLNNIKHGNIFDENFLMMVASIGAIIINEMIEANLVVLLFTIGEYFQNKALDKSTAQIASLNKLKVDYATLSNGEQVLVNDVKIGDLIVVKVGERVPLDGVIVDGSTSLDMKILTGESLPCDVGVNDEVLSGCINLNNVITIKVTKEHNESTTSKIIKLVEVASSKKSKTEKFITKFARIYTPIVFIAAIIVFLVEWLLIDSYSLFDALNNCFVFLVASCPCALVISIPLAVYAAIGRCSSFGVLVKGGNYIEAISKVETICFDKTGTLTKGNFKVSKIEVFGLEKEEFINILVSVEKYSNHPIAKAIAMIDNSKTLDVFDIKEIAGFGIECIINNKKVLVGNNKLMNKHNLEYAESNDIGSIVYVSVEDKVVGYVVVNDEIKKESVEIINCLNNMNIKTVLLTGDKETTANKVANELNINNVYSQLLPEDKLEILENEIKNKNEKSSVLYVGDGINDTPSLKLADVGVAISGLGNDEAVEASDVVLLSDNMNSLVKTIKISKFTKTILIQNIVFSLLFKFAALIIGTIGILGSYGMLLGVLADVGVCLVTILNTIRILKKLPVI